MTALLSDDAESVVYDCYDSGLFYIKLQESLDKTILSPGRCENESQSDDGLPRMQAKKLQHG